MSTPSPRSIKVDQVWNWPKSGFFCRLDLKLQCNFLCHNSLGLGLVLRESRLGRAQSLKSKTIQMTDKYAGIPGQVWTATRSQLHLDLSLPLPSLSRFQPIFGPLLSSDPDIWTQLQHCLKRIVRDIRCIVCPSVILLFLLWHFQNWNTKLYKYIYLMMFMNGYALYVWYWFFLCCGIALYTSTWLIIFLTSSLKFQFVA